MSASTSMEDDNFFHDHLEGFAGARTNPYAIRVAAQICKDFRLSVAGQRRLNKALNDLPCIDTLDPQLTFAWSHEHVIRNPRVHRFGYEHLTVIITLAECFHETYAAEVFHALAKETLPPSQITPHVYQWLDLLHFCNGILAASDFSIFVENFILLDPYSVTPGGKYAAERCLVPPQSLAKALLALAELTCGKRETLTLRGGGVVGYMAALAEQFFDISCTIETKKGDHLHGTTDGAKLNLIYTERPEIIIEDTSMAALTRELTEVKLAPFSNQIHFLPYGGRVTWATLLPHVFGQRFYELDHTHAKAMYSAIGAAFRAIEGAKDSSSISVKAGPHATLASHPPLLTAEQLISTATVYMSSLQHGQGRMEKAARHSSQDAAKEYFQHVATLRSACKCAICGTLALPEAARSNAEKDAGYCMTAIVETIIALGLLLSRVVLAQPLNPTREGVQLLYKTRIDKYLRTQDHATHKSGPNAVATLYDNALDAPASQILRQAVKVFAGGHLPPLGTDLLPYETVAIAHDGMCAFVAELAAGQGTRRDIKGMIRIINGGFGIRQKTYRLAAWGALRPAGKEGWQWDEVEIEHLKSTNGGKLWLK